MICFSDEENICFPSCHSFNISSNAMVQSLALLTYFISALRDHQYQTFSLYLESIYTLIFGKYLFHCLFGLSHFLGGKFLSAFLFSCSFFILQCLIFFCGSVMYLFEIVRHINKHVVKVIFQFPAPPYILKPVMCHILFSLYSRIRSLFIPVVGIAPHAGILFSDRVSLTLPVYVPAELMERYLSVLLLQKICVAFKGFVKFL